MSATDVWTAIAALGSVGSALAAAIYTHFTYKLLLAQIEPLLVVTVVADSDRSSILMIRIRNIGSSIARDIRFTPSRPIPWQAWGMDPETAQPASVMSEGPLVHGIAALGPQDSRDITWGQFGGLESAMQEGPIELEYSYRHNGRKITGKSVLEVSSFRGTDASERPLPAMARSLKALEKDVRDVGAKLVKVTSAIESLGGSRGGDGESS